VGATHRSARELAFELQAEETVVGILRESAPDRWLEVAAPAMWARVLASQAFRLWPDLREREAPVVLGDRASIRQMAGRCADGAERDSGELWHLVMPNGIAICGRRPGRRSAGWSSEQGATVTCSRCELPRIGPCRDPLRLWFLEYLENGQVFRRYYADRGEARFQLKKWRRFDAQQSDGQEAR